MDSTLRREIRQRKTSGKTHIGLVLEGGAMRGMFTAGALDVLMENGIEFEGTIGVSAGAVFGCNLKSRQIGRAVRYNMRYCSDWRYCSYKSLLLTGDLYGVNFCYKTLPFALDLFDTEALEENPMEFFVVATDAETGKAVYRKLKKGTGADMQWLRASASMPLVSRPVRIRDRFFLDGGIADPIPLQTFESLGFSKNVVILTQPASYRKKKLRNLGLIRAALRRYPRLVARMADRHNHYNQETEYVRQREAEGAVFAIRPDAPLEIGSMEHDPRELLRVYLHGREVMGRELPKLRAFLANACGKEKS